MSTIEVISAILDGDAETMRCAFCRIMEGEQIGPERWVHAAILWELCMALQNDQDTLPHAVCVRMGVPVGATFADGVERYAENADLVGADEPTRH